METPEDEPSKPISEYQKIAQERLKQHIDSCPNCYSEFDLCAEGYWLRKMAELP